MGKNSNFKFYTILQNKIIITFSFIFLFIGCNTYDSIDVSTGDANFGIPLIHASFGLLDVDTKTEDNIEVVFDSLDRVFVNYKGEVLRQDALDVFFPLPLLSFFPVADTVAPLALPIPDEVIINKVIFNSFTNIQFKFTTSLNETIPITLKIPEFTKDGEIFEKTYTIEPSGEDTTRYETIFYNMDYWVFESESDNVFEINYDARDAMGNRIKLDRVEMFVDVLSFRYGEGYFGQRNFNIEKDIIEVNIFQNWLSGGFTFDDPKVTMYIKNSFGFPVRSIFNKIEITTINDNVFELESTNLMGGVDFNYPSISEIGSTKETSFDFTSDNSNIGQIFNEKAKKLFYDLDAITNPENESIIGFYTDSSYYSVDIAVEVPLWLKARDLVLTDTVSLNFGDQLDRLHSGEIIGQIKNAYPVDVSFKMEFLNEKDEPIVLLPAVDWISINSTLDQSQSLADTEEQLFSIPIEQENLDLIQKAKKIAIIGKFDTDSTVNDESIWLHTYQGIDIKVSASFKLK